MKSRLVWRLILATLAISVIFYSGCISANKYPTITSLRADKGQVILLGSSEIVCVASDENGDTLSYSWSATGGTLSRTGPVVTWTAPNTPGSYIVTAEVTDGRGGEATRQVTVNVLPNRPPVIEKLVADLPVVLQAQSTAVNCVASDPDGDELTYEWAATGGKISGKGTAVTWTTPPNCGTYAVTVTVTDTRGEKTSREIKIRVVEKAG